MAKLDMSKMKMPEAKKPASDEDMEMDFEAAPEDEDAIPYAGEESPAEEAAELKDIPDEELIKEMKRRGLSLESAKPEKMEDIDMDMEAAQ